MNIKTLKALIEAGSYEKLIQVITDYCLVFELKELLDQYHPQGHSVRDTAIRKDKSIKDDDGNLTSVIPVNRLSLPIQKDIVMVAAAFLGRPEIDCVPTDEMQKSLLGAIQKIQDDTKIDFVSSDIWKLTMSERQAAELWYPAPAEPDYWAGYSVDSKVKLKMKVLAGSRGDTLHPVFDVYNDLIAFGRSYTSVEIDEAGTKNEVQHFDLYTSDRIYFLKKSKEADWSINKDEPTDTYPGDGKPGRPNTFGKIPVIYYSQPFTEWNDVQCLIDRLETKISNHADTNDYFDSPIVKAKGKIDGFANKGESGKLLEMDKDADVDYLTWNNAPESTKMEIENLRTFIYKYTHTPDISFDSLKSMGLGNVSGIAIKMLFLDAHLKATDKEAQFGIGVQRRYNFLKSAVCVLDNSLKPALNMVIKPKFKYFLPDNIDEIISTVVSMVQAKLISLSTARTMVPVIKNPELEAQLIEQEASPTPTN